MDTTAGVEESTRVAAALEEVGGRLAQRGLRFTRQRRAVTLAVLGAHQAVTANEIHDRARGLCPELGLMTVYRALELLAEVGVVRTVYSGEHREAFVSASSAHGHAVVCTLCGRTEEFTECHIQALAAAAAEQTGYAISDHLLQFSGVCRECQLRDGADRNPGRGPRR
jgi:Fur family ferric uptake transcriptional regulator